MPQRFAGGAIGIGLATWAIEAFKPIAPAALPRVETIEVNATVLIVSTLALMLTGVIASLLPAAQAWRTDLTGATREDNRSLVGGRRHARMRTILVVAQVALSLPLLVGGSLLTRSFVNVSSVDPGFRTRNVLTMLMAIPRSKYTDDGKVSAMTERVVNQIAALPQVESVGGVSRLPLNGTAAIGYVQFDAPPFPNQETTSFDWRTATPDYFKTMGIPLREGRVFNEHDTADAKPVGIIDERIARLVWPGQSAVGKRFRIPFEGQPWVEVIGVVGHVKHDGLDDDRRAQVYWNHWQRAQDRLALVVKARPGTPLAAAEVINAIHIVDPEQPVYDVQTMDVVVRRSLSARWLNTMLISAFALMTLMLSCIGLYGVVAFGVTQQKREFGVRLALGATRAGIARLVLRRGAMMAIAGSAAGLALSVLLTRSMSSMLFGITALDAASFAGSMTLLLVVTLLASYLPARRAAAVEPAITLRTE